MKFVTLDGEHHQVEEVAVNGRWLLWLPQHRAARPEWPWWEATRLAAMRTVISHGSVVWDVGAEEGDFPALWASWGAQVFMAEPNPRVWPNIRLVWEANGLGDPIGCWPGFLGERSGEDVATMVAQLWGRETGEVWPDCASGPVIGDHGFCQLGERPDLPTSSIDSLVGDGVPAPTVLTMDVEGSELHVLRGAERTLDEHRPDVFVSIHPEFMAHHYDIAEGVTEVRAFMHRRGYDLEDHVFLSIDHEHHYWFRGRS